MKEEGLDMLLKGPMGVEDRARRRRASRGMCGCVWWKAQSTPTPPTEMGQKPQVQKYRKACLVTRFACGRGWPLPGWRVGRTCR